MAVTKKEPRYIPPAPTRCPYCGWPVGKGKPTCTAHSDLPGLEPL